MAELLAQVAPCWPSGKLLGKSRYECRVARPLTLDTLRIGLWEGDSKAFSPGRTIPDAGEAPAFAVTSTKRERPASAEASTSALIAGDQHAEHQIRRT